MRLKHVTVLIRLTLSELFKKKTFHVLLALFLLFCFSVPLWQHFAPETELEFLADLGLGLIGFFLLIVTVIIASDVLPADLRARRTIFFVMHPIEKNDYLLGRAYGTFVFLGVSFAIFLAVLKGFFFYRGWNVALWPAFPLIIKYVVLAAFLFSVSPLVERFSAIFLGFSFYFLCNSLSTLSFLSRESNPSLMLFWIKAARFLFPHFEVFDTAGYVAAWSPAALAHLAKLSVYGGIFTFVYLFLAGLAIKRRCV